MIEQNEEWISVSELAQRINTTKQTVYNKIKQGVYPTKVFMRGTMRGLLVRAPKVNEND